MVGRHRLQGRIYLYLHTRLRLGSGGTSLFGAKTRAHQQGPKPTTKLGVNGNVPYLRELEPSKGAYTLTNGQDVSQLHLTHTPHQCQ